jgi:hypothetical protein
MRAPRSVLALLAALAATSPALGIFIRPEIERVPIDRVTANLERAIDSDPKNVELLINLARVHAMAYALKRDDVEMATFRGMKDQTPRPWFGHAVPIYQQFSVTAAKDQQQAEAARRHLTQAVRRYREALAIAPQDLVARLGLGWTLMESGDRAAAIAELRAVVKDAYLKDRARGMGNMEIRSLTEEAANYLGPLLDPARDADEIAQLRTWSAEIKGQRRAITPIAVPLRGTVAAEEITTSQPSVVFDGDGSGIARRWTWITPDAAWLVFDHDGRGQIDSALQMFGSVTFWAFWANGYHALRSLDDDGDGEIRGRELIGLALWHDRNADGRSDRGEVRPVGDWNIVALSCAYEYDASHPDEIAWSPRGVRFGDGTARPTFDLVLHSGAAGATPSSASRPDRAPPRVAPARSWR